MPEVADVLIIPDGPPEEIEIVPDPVDASGQPLVEVSLPEGADESDDVTSEAWQDEPDEAVRQTELRWHRVGNSEGLEALQELYGDDGYQDALLSLDTTLQETEIPSAILELAAGADDDAPANELVDWLARGGEWLRTGRRVSEPEPVAVADLFPLHRAIPGVVGRLQRAWRGDYLANMAYAGKAAEVLRLPEKTLASLRGDDEAIAEAIALAAVIGRRLVHGAVHLPEREPGATRGSKTMTTKMTESQVDDRIEQLTRDLHAAYLAGDQHLKEKLNRERSALAAKRWPGDTLIQNKPLR